jgi:indole-3-glycerol phosphate synthase
MHKTKNPEGMLAGICANKRLEVARQQEAVPLTYLENILSFQYPEKISFKQALIHSDSGIIAEFKRRSPSKGWIHPDADVEKTVQGYKTSGASALSCLTDECFFGGGFSDFKRARAAAEGLPVLRKDFIIDEYQIYQSKVMGADLILLIAACLSREETFRFTEIAHALDMEVLLEIHTEKELDYIQPNVDIVGVNNRNLKTFVTDIRHTIDLAHKIPEEYVKISESGLSEPETVLRLRKEGFNGFLMGENFMKARDPAQALKEFIRALSPTLSLSGKTPGLKVCGMKDPENIRALASLPVDMIGLIFYEKSPRYAGELDSETVRDLPASIQKTGVFVNASQEYILAKIKAYGLQLIQLHGNESPAFCQDLKSGGIKVIKAFSIREAGDLTATALYENTCNYFLFDTKTSQFGGSGKKFDWEILSFYTGKTPFFLSGGIGAEDTDAIRQIKHPLLYALDLNSKFETKPGLKNIEQLREFVMKMINNKL